MNRIYCDHAATSPMVIGVLEAMRPFLTDSQGNASSMYEEGRAAKCAIDESRESLSEMLGCEFGEVTFTGSGTEAVNLALIGLTLKHLHGVRKRVLMSTQEHHAATECTELLGELGFKVEFIRTLPNGVVDLSDFSTKLDDSVLAVCIMHANNETGAIQPVQFAFEQAHRIGAVTICDCVQTFGNLMVKPKEMGADLVAISAHKIGGPKGMGALFVEAGIKLQPLLLGGGQERELRAGTESVANIVGFAEAIRQLGSLTERTEEKWRARDAFERTLENGLGGEIIWTLLETTDRLSGHSHFRVPGIQAESLLIRLDRLGVSASSGAACSSGSVMPSHVLLAMGFTDAEAKEGVRFTFGPEMTAEIATEAAQRTISAVKEIRQVR